MVRKLFVVILLVVAGSYAYKRVTRPQALAAPQSATAPDYSAEPPVIASRAAPEEFHCDGRVRCSQMRSCEEARYFLQHCSGVKMDGDGDGIPCEREWCGR